MMGTRVIVPGRNVCRRSGWSLTNAPRLPWIFAAILLLASAGLLRANPILPIINTNQIFDVTNSVFAGGAFGNAASNNAAAIQAAINTASASIVGGATGGTVRIFPVGTLTTYMSGP